MPVVDLSLTELRQYRPEVAEPADFDAFWARTLRASGIRPPRFEPIESRLELVDVYDVRYDGFGNEPVAAWLLLPHRSAHPVPIVVQYPPYGAGRGSPLSWLTWPAAGLAAFVMDVRAQGVGATPDPHGSPHAEYPGFVTRGVLDPDTYYYRRVIVDAVRAVDAATDHPAVAADRLLVAGVSQGGGLAQAVAGLRNDIFAVLADVPFLSHFERALEVSTEGPYCELATFLRDDPSRMEATFLTLGYVDSVAFARRATAAARFSVALSDMVCPPSTVFAAFNAYAGPRYIDVYPYSGHEGGGVRQLDRQLRWVKEILASE